MQLRCDIGIGTAAEMDPSIQRHQWPMPQCLFSILFVVLLSRLSLLCWDGYRETVGPFFIWLIQSDPIQSY